MVKHRTSLTNKIHRMLSRSQHLVNACIKLRNQCNAVIGCFVGESINPAKNGEQLLMEAIAPTAQCFMDVGANIGSWSRQFVTLMPSSGCGLAFEPGYSTFSELQRNLASFPQVQIINAALGETAGFCQFYEDPNSSELSHIVRSHNIKNDEHLTRLSTVDIELDARDWGKVDFLKIDTEGHDLLVLRGARESLKQRRISIVQFEYNAPWRETSSTLSFAIDFLESFGYRTFILRSSGLHRLDYKKLGEYFSYSNYVAVSPEAAGLINRLLRGPVL